MSMQQHHRVYSLPLYHKLSLRLNLHQDKTGVESELLGINYPLSRNDTRKPFESKAIEYPTYKKEVTAQSRTIAPVWTARDLEQNHRFILPMDPQANVIPLFEQNVSTRILEKNKREN